VKAALVAVIINGLVRLMEAVFTNPFDPVIQNVLGLYTVWTLIQIMTGTQNNRLPTCMLTLPPGVRLALIEGPGPRPLGSLQPKPTADDLVPNTVALSDRWEPSYSSSPPLAPAQRPPVCSGLELGSKH
jgi:hypothetical protein